jgi:hypothetical protein
MPDPEEPAASTEPDAVTKDSGSPAGDDVKPHRLSIAEAKAGLAERFGVEVDAVEITIRS